MKAVIEALIGTQVRFARDDVGYVLTATLRACGFGSDDIWCADKIGQRSENGKRLAAGIYTISHVELSPNIAGVLYIGIKEWGDTKAEHNSDHFELLPKLEAEPRTESDHQLTKLSQVLP